MRAVRLSLSLAATLGLTACAHLPGESNRPSEERAEPTPASTVEPERVAGPERVAESAPQPTRADALNADASPPPPPEPVDLWGRIRQGFAMPMPEHRSIEQEIAAFSGRQGYFDRVAERAEPYLHYIVEEVERRGMPTEIALLPIVESAFRPFAYSPGRAAGLWQFIPATGRHYGLRQSWWYDGRRDVIASTNAALDYLQRLHGLFDGDWMLALAAYNAGEGTVGRAVRRNKARGKPIDFFSLDLPRETEGYVPRLLALRELVREPESYDLSLRPLVDEPYIEVVQIDSQLDLALAAEMADLTVEEVYRLNPGFNRWATDPEGPHSLVLPHDRVERFRKALADLPPEKRVQWRRHRVQSGETLIHIARRYRTTVDVLQQANNLRGHMIRAGHYLLVPTASAASEDYVLSASQRRASLMDAQRSGQKTEYTVRSGDSFWVIARRHGVGVSELAAWNGMSPRDTLRPGQKLVIWSKGASATATSLPRQQRVRYTVRSGDSLYTIAQRFNVSINDLRRWNSLNGKYLQPGQRLTLHVDVTNQGGSI